MFKVFVERWNTVMMRTFLLLLMLLFWPFYLTELWAVMAAMIKSLHLYSGFFIGVGSYLLFLGVVRRIPVLSSNHRWFQTLSHEITHALFSILSFNRVSSLLAESGRGGSVSYFGRPNVFIVLSPYCVPVFTVAIIGINSFLAMKFWYFADIAVGVTYMFHIATFSTQLRPRQSDIRIYGIVFSYVFVVFVNTLFAGIVLQNMKYGGAGAAWHFVLSGFERLSTCCFG